MKKLIFTTIFILVVCVIACTSEKAQVIKPIEAPDSCSVNVTYSNDISAIVARSCSLPTCHEPNGTYDFTSYSLLTSHDMAELKKRINGTSTYAKMPLLGTYGDTINLSNCELAKFNAWLDTGNPNN